jgi:hypothetical protein
MSVLVIFLGPLLFFPKFLVIKPLSFPPFDFCVAVGRIVVSQEAVCLAGRLALVDFNEALTK